MRESLPLSVNVPALARCARPASVSFACDRRQKHPSAGTIWKTRILCRCYLSFSASSFLRRKTRTIPALFPSRCEPPPSFTRQAPTLILTNYSANSPTAAARPSPHPVPNQRSSPSPVAAAPVPAPTSLGCTAPGHSTVGHATKDQHLWALPALAAAAGWNAYIGTTGVGMKQPFQAGENLATRMPHPHSSSPHPRPLTSYSSPSPTATAQPQPQPPPSS